jgi:hypothetical protein
MSLSKGLCTMELAKGWFPWIHSEGALELCGISENEIGEYVTYPCYAI